MPELLEAVNQLCIFLDRGIYVDVQFIADEVVVKRALNRKLCTLPSSDPILFTKLGILHEPRTLPDLLLWCKMFKPDATKFAHGEGKIVEAQRVVFGLKKC